MLERIKELIEKIKGNEEHRHDLADTLLQLGTKNEALEKRIVELEEGLSALVGVMEEKLGIVHADAPAATGDQAAPAAPAAQQVETAPQA
ncbi:conserved protein of unknown function [Burkholderia multivorans]